ncbi:hypothetical protein SARC_01754 [Sphaeroforma arctica JP610]|uniref:Uncharacterized protein n=1 Tax=Sphaeroforma arctica JP610 TaxID=667725 RepID=A0A0L0GAU2_9EUKA|nr:hypothetical protein SARC_01754 [Sphaeroforma arctica JP610]KNC86095.1 hypothetical protein SARC_01754 [Sphaeroforma arctica JP610]|eukprot:XP_014159997.1 hypothetical protein SARC_01754 [Sphaeroforma arctica JP610]
MSPWTDTSSSGFLLNSSLLSGRGGPLSGRPPAFGLKVQRPPPAAAFVGPLIPKLVNQVAKMEFMRRCRDAPGTLEQYDFRGLEALAARLQKTPVQLAAFMAKYNRLAYDKKKHNFIESVEVDIRLKPGATPRRIVYKQRNLKLVAWEAEIFEPTISEVL